tara:strand:+ start:328 stop:678 length:351 start_codon:yes stop_codon:yes gene_type:complete
MIKPMERGKQQDPDYEKEKNEYPAEVKREDGIPTIDDWEKLLGKEGKVTGRKKEEDCGVDGVMIIEETVTSEPSMLSKLTDKKEKKKEEPNVDLDKVDSRHDDIINFVESILKLAR